MPTLGILLIRDRFRVFVEVSWCQGFEIVVDAMTPVWAVKDIIQRDRGIPSERQRLTHQGYELQNESSLGYHNIQMMLTPTLGLLIQQEIKITVKVAMLPVSINTQLKVIDCGTADELTDT